MKPKIKLLLITSIFLITCLNVFAQVPTNQDCLNAIPICSNSYSTVISYTGTGNYPNEINNGTSCLASGERNDVWYTFTTPFFGNLNFTITPNNPNDDYDWAVYNLTNNTCSDIFNNPGIEVSCNYAPNLGCGGTTGPNNNTSGACGGQNESAIAVTPGQTYVINVSNFSSTQSGYLLDFNASSAGIFDVFPPGLSFSTTPTCGSTSVTWTFSENVTCASVQASDFVLTGPGGGPYTVTSISSTACSLGAAYGKAYTINFTPAIAFSGAYNMALVSPVTDLCGNDMAVPFNKSYSVNGVNLVKNHTDVTCPGDDDGTITLNAIGVGPFTYQWSPNVSSSNTATGLPGGVYTITVTPSNASCPGQATITVVENLPVAILNQTIVPSGCSVPAGSISVTPSGGVGPYTYQWSPSGGNAATASSLASGNYTLTVTDTKGCDLTQMFTVTSVNNLGINVSGIQNVKCKNGTDGSITTSVTGASGPVTYLWNTNAVTPSLNGIPAGTYSVTVTEGICTATAQNILIAEPVSALASTPLATATTCGSSNGSVTLNPTGGTGAYTFVWSPSGSGASSTGLAFGNYTITIKDANLCTLVKNVNVAASSAPIPTVTYARQTVSCFGGNNGNATINVAGGAGPYSYQWSAGLGTGSTKNNLAAGIYTVTVTDALNCSATVTVTINAPAVITAVASAIQNVKCFGLNTGSASINAAGGTGSLSYQWSPAGGNNAAANNLVAGAYTVTVTDANGCTKNVNLSITQPTAALNALGNATATTCGNSNGVAGITASGGTAPYTYVWSNAATATTLSAILPGTYTVTVTDANLCTKVQSVTIGNSSAPVISNPVIQNLNCATVHTGSIGITVSSGVSPYSYTWTSNVSTTNSATNLPAGNYNVVVTDNSGCTVAGNYQVTSPPAILFQNSLLTHVNCFAQNTGSISTSTSGGIGPVTYVWSTGTTGLTVSNLNAGTYTVTATDQNNCIAVQSFQILQPAAALAVSINAGNTTCGLINGTVGTTTNGGTIPYTFAWSNGATTASISNLSSGVYTATVTDSKGCTNTKSTSIAPSSAPAINSPVIQHLTCAGVPSGSIAFSVSGGITPYSYVWSNNVSTGNNAVNLAGGNYTVSITDNAGCSITSAFQVTSPSAISVALVNKSDVDCFGNNAGEIEIAASGGTGNLSYLWSNSMTTPHISSLLSGTYTVSVSDQNNCKKTNTYTISQPAAALMSQINPTATSCGLVNGTADAIPSGGTAPYKYLWSSGANTALISTLAAGTYSVTVSDINGCTVSQSTTILSSSAVTIAAVQHTDALCFGTPTGTASVNAAGGILPYTYAWSNGNTSQQLSGINAGTYQVTISDQAGCTIGATVNIIQPLALQVQMPAAQTVCSGVSTTLTPQVSGGTLPYQYTWSTNLTSPSLTISPTVSGQYSVSIKDGNGCTRQSVSSTVNVFPPVLLASLNNVSVCEGTTLNFSAAASGGTGVYQYNWGAGFVNSPAFSNQFNASGLVSVMVQDGCGYTATQSAAVNVVPLPKVDFSNDLSIGCVPLKVEFNNHSIAVAGSDYQWDFGDGTYSTDAGNVSNVFSLAGNFTPSLTITTPSPELCSASFTLPDPVISLQVPIADFSFSPEDPTILNPSVSFKNLAQFSSTYTWNFGDGVVSNEPDPTHTFGTIGTYAILLTVSNSYCEDTVLKILEVTDQYSFYIPKGFTPNGDGRNDVFEAYGTNMVEAQVSVYSRWGQPVFSAHQFPFSWNGRMNNTGNELPSGVYIYAIVVTDKFEKKHVFKGSVNLLR